MFGICFGAISFWLIGYGVAFGKFRKSDFIGINTAFYATSGLEDLEEDFYIQFIFQLSFVSTCSTIVSGSLAERTKLIPYIGFSFIFTALIYPLVVSWTWGGGWLAQRGFKDFAGSGVVHMVGGTASFCSAYIVGPRYGYG